MNDSNYVNGEFFVRIKSLLHFHTSCWLLSHIHRRCQRRLLHHTHIYNRLVECVLCVKCFLHVVSDCLLTAEMSTELKMRTLTFITFYTTNGGVFVLFSRFEAYKQPHKLDNCHNIDIMSLLNYIANIGKKS